MEAYVKRLLADNTNTIRGRTQWLVSKADPSVFDRSWDLKTARSIAGKGLGFSNANKNSNSADVLYDSGSVRMQGLMFVRVIVPVGYFVDP